MQILNIDFSILGPALLTGLLVTLTHVPLGQRVLQRGIIFLDLAVAQVAGLGIILAYSFHWETGGWQMQLIATGAAIIAVLLLNYTEHRWPEIQEALIGSLFVLASSAGILLLATSAQAGEQLKDLLVGQILWVSYEQLIPVSMLYAIVLGLWFGLLRFRKNGKSSSLAFYLLFAITITASVQLVGVYLVFASLILPALATRSCSKYATHIAYILSFTAYVSGLLLAMMLDLPSGSVIIFTLAGLSLFSAALIAHSHKKNVQNN